MDPGPSNSTKLAPFSQLRSELQKQNGICLADSEIPTISVINELNTVTQLKDLQNKQIDICRIPLEPARISSANIRPFPPLNIVKIPDGASSPYIMPRKNGRLNGSARSNGDMKPRETVVSCDFHEEIVPPSQICCGTVKVTKACRLVAVLSLFALLGNAILYFFGLSRLGLNAYFEFLIIAFDFIAVICLFMGISKKRPGLLKPYLFFMSLWCIGLSILFCSCLWNFIKTKDFSKSLMLQIMNLRGEDLHRARHARHREDNMDGWIAFLLILSLGLIVFIDCYFIHIVYRTFQHFAYKEDKGKNIEVKRNGQAHSHSNGHERKPLNPSKPSV